MSVPAPPVPVPGYTHVYSGKVRDLYRGSDESLLFVASDRISAYDWVLPTPIPEKGEILTQMSLWWFERLAGLVGNHTLDLDVPASVSRRAMRCQPLEMFPVECVARGYLTGSGFLEYQGTGSTCGVALARGLLDGSKLPSPIFTPATKAALGDHDENVDFATVERTIGEVDAAALRRITLDVYRRAAEIAGERGILIADTKFEFGRDRGDPNAPILIADEVLTPDSSRFWPANDWQAGRPGGQVSFDKQFVRDWLMSPASGWDRSSGQPPPPLPAEVVERTHALYVRAYEQLTARRWDN